MRVAGHNEGEGDCDDWYGVTAILIAMSSVPASIWGAHNSGENRVCLIASKAGNCFLTVMVE